MPVNHLMSALGNILKIQVNLTDIFFRHNYRKVKSSRLQHYCRQMMLIFYGLGIVILYSFYVLHKFILNNPRHKTNQSNQT